MEFYGLHYGGPFFVVLLFINVIRPVESINMSIKIIKMIYFNNHMFKKYGLE